MNLIDHNSQHTCYNFAKWAFFPLLDLFFFFFLCTADGGRKVCMAPELGQVTFQAMEITAMHRAIPQRAKGSGCLSASAVWWEGRGGRVMEDAAQRYLCAAAPPWLWKLFLALARSERDWQVWKVQDEAIFCISSWDAKFPWQKQQYLAAFDSTDTKLHFEVVQKWCSNKFIPLCKTDMSHGIGSA